MEDNFTSLPTFSSASLPPHKLSLEGYYTSAAVLLLIACVGFCNNVAVMCVMLKNKHLRTPLNALLLNLSFSDMGISLVGAPVSMVAALQHGWRFAESVCVTYAFLMSLFGITSITTLTVLSIERCLMITRPLIAQELTSKRAKFTILAIWWYSVFLTAPPLLGWGRYGIEGPGISCSVDWESKSVLNSSYIFFLFTFGLGLPVTSMAASYIQIVCTLRSHNATTTATTTTTTRAEKRVAVMVFVMVFAFLVAWLPYATMALTVAMGNEDIVTPVASVAPAIFAKTSCIYNPIIYVGLNTQFRSAWMQLVHCTTSDRQHQPHTTEKISLTNFSDQHQLQHQQRQQQEQQQEQQARQQLNRVLVVDKDGKNHLAVPLREFKANSLSSSDCTSVSEMV